MVYTATTIALVLWCIAVADFAVCWPLMIGPAQQWRWLAKQARRAKAGLVEAHIVWHRPESSPYGSLPAEQLAGRLAKPRKRRGITPPDDDPAWLAYIDSKLQRGGQS